MSKKGKQMDVYFQVWNIRRCLKSCGIQSDMVDSNSLIDSKLYYPENEENILKQIGVTKYDKTK